MVKNNHIITQTWGVLVTHMYFPIEVSFSMSKEDEEAGEDTDVGYDLAMAVNLLYYLLSYLIGSKFILLIGTDKEGLALVRKISQVKIHRDF